MATTVTLTGTGLPNVAPGRAGAGVFVKHNDIVLQFDAGRATCNRLIEKLDTRLVKQSKLIIRLFIVACSME